MSTWTRSNLEETGLNVAPGECVWRHLSCLALDAGTSPLSDVFVDETRRN